MQLFELVSPRLFRPLAGPNRAFYAELLLLLWEECRHTADYSISRAEAVSRAEDYFAALAKPLALDADDAGDEAEQPTRDPHTLALGFLLRLRRTGWLEEQPGSYEGEASLAFVPEVTPLLEALEEILNPRVVTYTGKLYKAWQLLGSIGQEKSPYENVLREVDADLDALNRSLRALNASIGHYIDRLTRNRTPQAVLALFDIVADGGIECPEGTVQRVKVCVHLPQNVLIGAFFLPDAAQQLPRLVQLAGVGDYAGVQDLFQRFQQRGHLRHKGKGRFTLIAAGGLFQPAGAAQPQQKAHRQRVGVAGGLLVLIARTVGKMCIRDRYYALL